MEHSTPTVNPHGVAGRLAQSFTNSRLTPLIILVSIVLGIGATLILPREEEPQIIVPMADVFVSMPGATAREVEQRVTYPVEKLARELPTVEYVYSTSRPGSSMVIVRFYVGTDPEEALVQLSSKLQANLDRIPPGVTNPLVKMRSIDDVPILALTLSSTERSGLQLRQIAAELERQLKQIDQVSEIRLIGGQSREIRVQLRSERLVAYGLSPQAVLQALQSQNVAAQSGSVEGPSGVLAVRTDSFFRSVEKVENAMVKVVGGHPVYLKDVADIVDSGTEPSQYVLFGSGPAWNGSEEVPDLEQAVTISIAKRGGANAIRVSEAVLSKVERLKPRLLPSDVRLTVTRNYGETAAERSNELLHHMGIAVVSVTALIWLALGRRESIVVAVAIPVTLALTLATFVLYDFTLNRVTFFALIFSIGILVDDAIVVVENVVRHLRMSHNRDRDRFTVIVEAVEEVGNPTILATFTVVAAILPMAFVSGLMGPYMLPIPLGASAAMLFSMVVAFSVVPWAALRTLSDGGHHQEEGDDLLTRLYHRVMDPLIASARWRAVFLVGIVGLLAASVALVPLRLVVFKMLPFDNKSEFQVIVDAPEGTTLETTTELAQEMARALQEVPEMSDYQIYAGTASPYNFNGLVRHYYVREGPHLADIQVNLVGKESRSRQSHEIAKEIRPKLTEIAQKYGAVVQVTEIPPGPPVIQTLVTEVYGPIPEKTRELAQQVKELYLKTDGVVDVDWYQEDPHQEWVLKIDEKKAALSEVSPVEIRDAVDQLLKGVSAGLLHDPDSAEPVSISMRLTTEERADLNALKEYYIPSKSGKLVPLKNLVQFEKASAEFSIYHKNMQPVIYVTGDVAGGLDSPLYSILELGAEVDKMEAPDGSQVETHLFVQPPDTETYSIKWDGEWQVTYEVFRDMGIAFAVVLLLIYALITGWFQDFVVPLVILSAIPFSMVGILPAHWLLGSFFTATSMIGFIAGAGIVVRNSIILVDFIELRVRQGAPLESAVVEAGAVRFRPMLLTAAAVVVGSAVILADPIFNGLAISLMAGEVASLLLSRTAVPVLYYMVKAPKSSVYSSTPPIG